MAAENTWSASIVASINSITKLLNSSARPQDIWATAKLTRSSRRQSSPPLPASAAAFLSCCSMKSKRPRLSLNRLLLGVLDKATLRLGDNNVVNFERTLIFLTSNLGAQGMMKEFSPAFGFAADRDRTPDTGRLENITMAAVRRNFSPEFVNRIDASLTYQPLSTETLAAILGQQLNELQTHIEIRLGSRGFRLVVSQRGRDYLLKEGASADMERES